MKAIIMAGGEGSRLRPLTCNRPKPMVPVVNRPIMAYCIDLLKKCGIREIGVTLRYLPEAIQDYFGDGSEFGVRLHYFIFAAGQPLDFSQDLFPLLLRKKKPFYGVVLDGY